MNTVTHVLKTVSTILALGLLAACSSVAPSGPVPADEANRLHRQAVSAYDQGRYEAAKRLWQESLDAAYTGGHLDEAARGHYHLAMVYWKLKDGDSRASADAGYYLREHLDAAEMLMNRLQQNRPELELLRAEFSLQVPRAGDPDALTASVLNNASASADQQMQAVLIRLEASLQPALEEVFDASELTPKELEDRASRLVADVQSNDLKRRFSYWQAVKAIQEGNRERAQSYIIRALHEAKLSSDAWHIGQHYYEWSALERAGDNRFEALELVVLAARTWESGGFPEWALAVLRDAESLEADSSGGRQVSQLQAMKKRLLNEMSDQESSTLTGLPGTPFLRELSQASLSSASKDGKGESS